MPDVTLCEDKADLDGSHEKNKKRKYILHSLPIQVVKRPDQCHMSENDMLKTFSGKSRRAPAEVNPTKCKSQLCLKTQTSYQHFKSQTGLAFLSHHASKIQSTHSYFNIPIIPKIP